MTRYLVCRSITLAHLDTHMCCSRENPIYIIASVAARQVSEVGGSGYRRRRGATLVIVPVAQALNNSPWPVGGSKRLNVLCGSIGWQVGKCKRHQNNTQ